MISEDRKYDLLSLLLVNYVACMWQAVTHVCNIFYNISNVYRLVM